MIHLLLYVKRTMRVPSHFPGCSSFRACSHFEITSQICHKRKQVYWEIQCLWYLVVGFFASM